MVADIVLSVVFALCVLLIAFNWGCLIRSHLQKKHISMVPPLGAILAWGASSDLPIGWKLGAIALVLDPAVIATIGALVTAVVRRD